MLGKAIHQVAVAEGKVIVAVVVEVFAERVDRGLASPAGGRIEDDLPAEASQRVEIVDIVGRIFM